MLWKSRLAKPTLTCCACTQQAILLVDVMDYSVIEAARLVGVSEGTIKTRCARGRRILAQYLPRRRVAS